MGSAFIRGPGGSGASISEIRARLRTLLRESAELRSQVSHSARSLQETWERIQSGTPGPHLNAHRMRRPAVGEPPKTAFNGHGGGTNGLTRRELEVLRLVVGGHSTKQIAFLLGVSFKTAACHRWRVMQKLDVHETASVVRVALERGLIES